MGLMDSLTGGGLTDLQGLLASIGGSLLILMGFLQILVTAFALEGVPLLEVSQGLMDGAMVLGAGILIVIFAQALEE